MGVILFGVIVFHLALFGHSNVSLTLIMYGLGGGGGQASCTFLLCIITCKREGGGPNIMYNCVDN